MSKNHQQSSSTPSSAASSAANSPSSTNVLSGSSKSFASRFCFGWFAPLLRTSQRRFYCILFSVAVCQGLASATLGPILITLAAQTHTTLTDVVWLFFGRSLAQMAGSLIGGQITDRFVQHPRTIVLVPLIVIAITLVLIPNLYSLTGLMIDIIIQFLAIGWVDNAAQALSIRLLIAAEPHIMIAPFLHGLHFAWGLGSILSPLVLAPFLGKSVIDATGGSPTDEDASKNNSVPNYAPALYILATVFILPIIIILFIQVFISRKHREWFRSPHHQHHHPIPSVGIHAIESQGASSSSASSSRKNSIEGTDQDAAAVAAAEAAAHEPAQAHPVAEAHELNVHTVLVILICGLILFFYMGMEMYANFISTYAHEILSISLSTGALLTSGFWLFFTAGRGVTILVSHHYPPTKILLIGFSFTTVWSIILVLQPTRQFIFIVVSLLFGLTVSCIYSTTITFAQRYAHVNGTILSLLTTGDTLGAALLPLLEGRSLLWMGNTRDWQWFCFVVFLIVVSGFLCFWLVVCVVMPDIIGRGRISTWKKLMENEPAEGKEPLDNKSDDQDDGEIEDPAPSLNGAAAGKRREDADSIRQLVPSPPLAARQITPATTSSAAAAAAASSRNTGSTNV